MIRPWIAIPTRCRDKHETFGQNRRYIDAVLWAGGLPLLVPLGSAGDVNNYGERSDGILLPGSPTDIDPAHYGENRHPRLGELCAERDATDFALLEHAEQRGLPVLGICFGAQSLNVFRGGSLVQDIHALIDGSVAHERENSNSPEVRHSVRLERHSAVGRLASAGTIEVNTYHHQAVARAGTGLGVTAWAPDGVIEAVEDPSMPFFVGVQWHPERGWETDGFSMALFSAFVRAAGESQSGRRSV